MRDDGAGFAPDARATGFGLEGIASECGLASGTFRIDSSEHGTLVQARLPSARRPLASRVTRGRPVSARA